MAWTDTARKQHMRKSARYPSDLRDGEWTLIEPMLPGAQRWAVPHDGATRRDGRDLVYCFERLRMADAAQMLPARLNGARLFLRVAGQRIAGDHQPPAGDGSAPTSWPRGFAQRRSD